MTRPDSWQVLIKADMLDYYNVSGCYILKPWSYSIWESIQSAHIDFPALLLLLTTRQNGSTTKSRT